MIIDSLRGLPEYNRYEIDRNKLRFNGIGPRLHDEPGKIWPRDSIDPDDECRKILDPSLIKSISNPEQIEKIRGVVRKMFTGLKRCNVDSLINRFCPLDHGCFDRVTFEIHYALDAYTDFSKITRLIHHVIRSINQLKPKENKNMVLVIFGCHRNYEIFKRHIGWLVTGNKRLRKIVIGHMILFEGYSMDLSKIQWLRGLDEDTVCKVYIQVMYSITRFISELLRRYFYITFGNPFAYKLFYFRYDIWQKIHSKAIKQLIDNDVLYPFTVYNDVQLPVGAVSKLKFHLKREGLRLICTQPKDKSTRNRRFYQLRCVLKHISLRLRNHEIFNLESLLLGLRIFHEKLTEERRRVYFVRADIKNCFQSIKQELLREIINQNIASFADDDMISLYLLTHDSVKRTKHKTMKAWSLDPLEYQRIHDGAVISEMEKIRLADFDQEYLRPQIINPVLRESKQSKNAFNLVGGIRQGSSFSSVLCSIYIQTALNLHLEEFFDSNDSRIFRYVDDILFVSADLEKSKRFMDRMLTGFKDFNLKMNIDKLACNFQCEGLDKYESLGRPNLCRLTDFVYFLKQRISIDTLQCSYDYSCENISLKDSFSVSPYTNELMITNILEKFKIDLIYLDQKLNGFDQMVENVFERALLFAHRAATLILASFSLKNLDHQSPSFLIKLMLTVVNKLHSNIKSGLRRKLIDNLLTRKEICLLVSTAFFTTWNRREVRHRRVELRKIAKVRRRYMMHCCYHIKSDGEARFSDSQVLYWQKKITKLSKSFPDSSFAKQIIIPSRSRK